ncbi:MAG: hypothetical protein LBN02_01970 [Oscillospiraceae bacterium]|jgi:hypothetical protein|nr:hypothetical protein [Oscillospiraceae bacterium]
MSRKIKDFFITTIQQMKNGEAKGWRKTLIGFVLLACAVLALVLPLKSCSNNSPDINISNDLKQYNTYDSRQYNTYYLPAATPTIPLVLNPSNNYLIAMDHYDRLDFLSAYNTMQIAIDELKNDSIASELDIAKYCVALGIILNRLDKPDEGQTAFTEAITWYKISNADEKDYAFLYTYRGISYFENGKPDLAFDDLCKAEVILKTQENTYETRSELAHVYMTLGNYHWKFRGDDQMSLMFYINAIKLFSADGRVEAFGALYADYNALLVADTEYGQFILADYFDVRADLNSEEREHLAWVFANTANPLMEMGFFINANELLLKAEELFKTLPITAQYGLNFVYFSLSNVVLSLNMYVYGYAPENVILESIENLEKALVIFDMLGISENSDIAIVYSNLSALCNLSETRSRDEALQYGIAAYKIYESIYGTTDNATVSLKEQLIENFGSSFLDNAN